MDALTFFYGTDPPNIYMGDFVLKITFEGQEPSASLKYINTNVNGEKKIPEKASFSADAMSALVDIGNTPAVPGQDNKHTVLAGVGRDATLEKTGVLQDYRVVMAHTLSGEDLKKAEEEGFDIGNMSPEDTVTILDRVKAETAKGGTVIRGYNDDLAEGVLAEVGNSGLEGTIRNALAESNVPATDENIKAVKNSVALAESLVKPGEAQIAYMIENDLGTSVRDFYVAQNAAPAKSGAVNDLTHLDSPEMKQVKDRMIEAGKVLEDADEGYRKAEWLFERGLPVTGENILKEKNIEGIGFPVKRDLAVKSAVRALSDGKDAAEADLSGDLSIYEKAVSIEAKYFSEEYYSKSDISYQRKIQEIRLSMTAEVNIELIKSGFAIDTAPIEELLNELKAAEQAVALKYFPETAGVKDHDDNAPSMSIGSPEDAVKAYRLFNAVNNAVTEVSESPASALGEFMLRTPAEVAFREFEEIALGEKDRYRLAGETYEALMTEVRTDLGDSLTKAFGSVDSLITGLGLDLNDENRRHVRILARNHMEISQENVERIAEADRTVTGVIDKMKPAAVLDMIRNGINPLDKSFEELESFLDDRLARMGGFEKASEDYARFLYALDKNKEITAEERESYIGIYRMIDKIEKHDGAAIGAVVDTGAALQFSNLLTAVRSSRIKGMNVKVDENTGLTEIRTIGRNITEQILSSFADADKEYYEQKADDLRRSADFSAESLAILKDSDITAGADNLTAVENLISSEDDLFRSLLGEKNKNRLPEGTREKLKERAENALSDIASGEEPEEVYKDIIEEFASAAQEAVLEADSVIDVRAMQQINRQISLAVKTVAAGVEEYFVPMDIDGDMTKVRVSFRDSEDGSSSVDIRFKTASGTECRARFFVNGKAVNGIISVSNDLGLKKIGNAADIFDADLNSKGFDTSAGINLFLTDENETVVTYEYSGKDAGENRREGAGRKLLFGISEDFLKAVKESFYEDQL